MPSRFGSCRRAAFAIPPASHLSWRAKRLLTRASSPTLDAALCGVKGNSDTLIRELPRRKRFSLCHLCSVVDRRRSHFVNRLHSSLQIGPQLMWNASSAQSIINRSTHLLTPAIDTWHASISIPRLVWFRRADHNRCRFVGRRSRFDIVVVERNQDIRFRMIGRD